MISPLAYIHPEAKIGENVEIDTMVSNGPGRHEIIHRESSYSK